MLLRGPLWNLVHLPEILETGLLPQLENLCITLDTLGYCIKITMKSEILESGLLPQLDNLCITLDILGYCIKITMKSNLESQITWNLNKDSKDLESHMLLYSVTDPLNITCYSKIS